MTGMKEGAGEDPFADSEPVPTQSSESDADDERETESDSEPTMTETPQPTEIPMILRRDSVQDNRDRVPLFLQQETKRDERDALRELEARFDDDLSLTDLREALVLIGLDNLDDVEGQLRGWGYGLTFD
ncbi:hypothetical protein [Halocatena pleomorpha]|uniref:Uncharacterized protein n=1 Tax=Halocatena pleomorpha TaxID=1785090 RepID=A0A3P3R5Q8_9EURY|nr:hypothetical protein [Halocatena pleomorpha]RRJ28802.1 hypothetical protein EIK79_14875 [Halocatena pleomorpha]